MFGHVEVQNAPPVVRNDEEAVEHAKGQRRHGEEVHRGNGFAMIGEKSCPSICLFRIVWSLPHPAQHGSLRDIEAEHLQFSMNSRRTPSRILGNHTEDKFAQFFADAFSSSAVPMPREPCPIQLESCLVPANNGLRLDKDQGPFPFRPKPPHYHPEQFVWCGKARLRMPLLQYGELLPQCQVFQQQVSARTDRPDKQDKQ